MRNQDDLLKDRASEFIEEFRSNFNRCHVNSHLASRPIHHEWLDRHCLIVHLEDVEAINEIDIRFLQKALEVQTYWTIKPFHLNRMQVSFQCNLGSKGVLAPSDPLRAADRVDPHPPTFPAARCGD